MVDSFINPPLKPPTENVGVPNLVGIAKKIYWLEMQLTVKVFCLLLVNVLVNFLIKLLSYAPSSETP